MDESERRRRAVAKLERLRRGAVSDPVTEAEPTLDEFKAGLAVGLMSRKEARRRERRALADRFEAFVSFRLSRRSKAAIPVLESLMSQRDDAKRVWRVRRFLRRVLLDLLEQEGLLHPKQAAAPRERPRTETVIVQRGLFDGNGEGLDVERGYEVGGVGNGQ